MKHLCFYSVYIYIATKVDIKLHIATYTVYMYNYIAIYLHVYS